MNITNSSCNSNIGDGSITVQASGGGTFNFYLENYQNGSWLPYTVISANNIATFLNLPADTFRVIIIDLNNQCSDTLGTTNSTTNLTS
ncbi:MAG: hypothetical protein P8N46_04330, partial [Flavobacteriales bacterium]|nr:hypothetical protein [Flavobacteriales bacterium]